ncbi:hypothetical protein, partial [Cytobacillus kochii]|uniref:hypothetical protein n=1 Tax=Cytobacillus kochii TaxID=859143 RepID=UPI003F7EE6C4
TTVIIRPYKNRSTRKIWLTLYYERGQELKMRIAGAFFFSCLANGAVLFNNRAFIGCKLSIEK